MLSAYEIRQLVQHVAVGELVAAAAEEVRQRERHLEEARLGMAVGEGPALDRLVDDALRHVERPPVEGQRRQHIAEHDELLAPAVAPDILEEIDQQSLCALRKRTSPGSGTGAEQRLVTETLYKSGLHGRNVDDRAARVCDRLRLDHALEASGRGGRRRCGCRRRAAHARRRGRSRSPHGRSPPARRRNRRSSLGSRAGSTACRRAADAGASAAAPARAGRGTRTGRRARRSAPSASAPGSRGCRRHPSCRRRPAPGCARPTGPARRWHRARRRAGRPPHRACGC